MRRPIGLAVLALIIIGACTSSHGLPRAIPDQFSDLDAVTAHARDLAAMAGEVQPHHPAGAPPQGPARWMSFDWDPQQHASLDFGYGSAPHLEDFGKVFELDVTG